LFFGPAALVRLQADHRTAVGEVKAVGLTDGSVIDLDTASAVAVDYQPPRRAVDLLAGQAFFQVASDPRPFTVRAGEAAITVTGTAFDVRLSGERVEVAVQSGSVAVAVERQPELRLGPGDRLRIDRASGAVSRDRVVPSQIAAWRRGRLIADGATVAEVTAELGRYSPGLVLLRDLELGQRRVTGIYDLRDPAAALRAAVQPHGGRVTRLAGYLLLVEAAAE
jgi:transmembrane sensor